MGQYGNTTSGYPCFKLPVKSHTGKGASDAAALDPHELGPCEAARAVEYRWQAAAETVGAAEVIWSRNRMQVAP